MSLRRLLDTRARIYELLTHCIPADLILRVRVDDPMLSLPNKAQQSLTIELIRNLDAQLKVEIVQHAAFYEHRLQVCVGV